MLKVAVIRLLERCFSREVIQSVPTAQTKLFDLHQAFVVGRQLRRRLGLNLLARPNQDDLFDNGHHRRSVIRPGLIGIRPRAWCSGHVAERLDVKHFELTEEFAGGKRIKSGAAQAIPQGLQ